MLNIKALAVITLAALVGNSSALMDRITQRSWMDFSIGDDINVGRVTFGLYEMTKPHTTENFMTLSWGRHPITASPPRKHGNSGHALYYHGSNCHRVLKGMLM